MFTCHIEGQFKFRFILYLKAIKHISVFRARSDLLWAPANPFFHKSSCENYCCKKTVKFQTHRQQKSFMSSERQ